MNSRTVLSVLSAALLAFVAAACNFSPTSPFEGFGGEQGATLNGQFRQPGGGAKAQLAAGSTLLASTALTAAPQGEPVAVIVLDSDGNEIARVNIVNGAFTLRGLPGSFSLRFVDEGGSQVGEDMLFEGVKPNQEIDIVVALRNGSVVLLEERRTGIDHDGSSGIEIEGTATDIVIDTPPMTGSLYVNGYHILTRAAETSIRKGNRSLTLEDLNEGDRVHVRGVFKGDDVFAYEIKLQEEEEDEDDGTSGEACNVPDPAKPNHILVCPRGRTLSISPSAWSGHAGHGDTCGPCS
ncbi:MAG TPA: hypothetical protein VGC53_07635 [Vicinamibacteria bacterium]